MKLVTFFVLFLITRVNIVAQQEIVYIDFNCPIDITKHSVQTQKQIETLISKNYHLDTLKTISIFFSLTVDSTGKIWSAHIRKSENLKTDYYTTYSICRAIEENINVGYMVEYSHYMKSIGKAIPLDKYGNILVLLPYRTKR